MILTLQRFRGKWVKVLDAIQTEEWKSWLANWVMRVHIYNTMANLDWCPFLFFLSQTWSLIGWALQAWAWEHSGAVPNSSSQDVQIYLVLNISNFCLLTIRESKSVITVCVQVLQLEVLYQEHGDYIEPAKAAGGNIMAFRVHLLKQYFFFRRKQNIRWKVR